MKITQKWIVIKQKNVNTKKNKINKNDKQQNRI